MDKKDLSQYKILTQSLIDKIESYIDNIELSDDEFLELPSTYYDRNPYGVEEQLIGSSGGYFNDDQGEIFDAKKSIFLGYLECDGILSLIDIEDEDLKGDITVDDVDDIYNNYLEILTREIERYFD
jgi:hypothetical protein